MVRRYRVQSLGSLLKSARDIMRKGKGLNGDLDRLPMLTWIMFLKFLDDLELQRAEEAKLAGKKFKAAIEAPYHRMVNALPAEMDALKRLQTETAAELDALVHRPFKGEL
jgi:hypothetical protein